QCSVTLTLHRAAAALVCHHCHHHRRVPPTCAACGGGLEAFGVGTEQIASALRACYPLAAVDRLDRDAAPRGGAHRRTLDARRAATLPSRASSTSGWKGAMAPRWSEQRTTSPRSSAARRALSVSTTRPCSVPRRRRSSGCEAATGGNACFAARMCARCARSHAWPAPPTRRCAERVSGSQLMWIRTPCYSSRASPLLSWPCCASCSTPTLP